MSRSSPGSRVCAPFGIPRGKPRQTADVIGHDLLRQLADELPTRITSAVVDGLLDDYLNIVVCNRARARCALVPCRGATEPLLPDRCRQERRRAEHHQLQLLRQPLGDRGFVPQDDAGSRGLRELSPAELRCPGGGSRSGRTGQARQDRACPATAREQAAASATAPVSRQPPARCPIIRSGRGFQPRQHPMGTPSQGVRVFRTRSPKFVKSIGKPSGTEPARRFFRGIESSQETCHR